MVSFAYDGSGLEKLLEDKTLGPVQRRKIIATGVAIRMITAAVTTNNSTHKLADEMQNLARYVEAIERALPN